MLDQLRGKRGKGKGGEGTRERRGERRGGEDIGEEKNRTEGMGKAGMEGGGARRRVLASFEMSPIVLYLQYFNVRRIGKTFSIVGLQLGRLPTFVYMHRRICGPGGGSEI